MRKSIARIVRGAIFVTLLCSGVAFADDPPTMDAQQNVYLMTSEMVAVGVGDSIEFNLVDSLPRDSSFPVYYPPTAYTDNDTACLTCPLAYWTNCAHGAAVTVKGNKAYFDAGSKIALAQVLYAPYNTSPPSDGDEVHAGWTSFSSTSSTAVADTNGPALVYVPQDYEFQWQADDPAFDGTGSPITLTYTVTANP